MSAGRFASVLWRLMTIVVLVASGAYLLIYLYRWEWNRALISGLIFLAAEIVLVAATILSRLRHLEERQEEHGRARGLPASSARGDGDPGRSPFAWLDRSREIGVFVPVLMGVGVVLSALAYLVERLAASTAPVAGDEGQARRMAALDPLAGSLAPGFHVRALPPTRGWDLSGAGPQLVRVSTAANRIVFVLVSALLLTAAINVLADVTVNRPDPSLLGQLSVIELSVGQRSGGRPVVKVAEALWISCRGALPDEVGARSIEAVGTSGVRMVLQPAVGHNAERRFVGCLQDATLDLVQAEVTGFDNVPA